VAGVEGTGFAETLSARPSETGGLIASHDWTSTSLGPLEAWPQSLKTVVGLMLGSRQPVYIAWGPDAISLYNDGYIPILGDKHPRALGRPFREVFAEVWDEFAPLVAATLAGEAQHFLDQPIALAGRPGRPLSWFTFSWTPLRDDAGRVAGFYCAATETTEKVRTERALLEDSEAAAAESEARYRALFEAIESGFCIVEVDLHAAGGRIDYRVMEANPAFFEQTGFPKSICGRWLREAAPDLEEHWYETYGRVAHTGEPARFEQGSAHLARWFDVYAFRIGAPEECRVAILFNDISVRRQAEETLRASVRRQNYLLTLSDALRMHADPAAIQLEAMRVLGEHLDVTRAQYYEVEPDGDWVTSQGGYANGVPPVTARVRLDDFGTYNKEAYRTGETLAVADVSNDARVSAAELKFYDALGFRAFVGIPLVKSGRFVALLGLHHAGPHQWTGEEIELAEETADRTWAAVERARVEAALTVRETRYRALFDAIDAGFCIIEVIFDGAGKAVDYRFLEANPAFERQAGFGNPVGRRIRDIVPTHEERWFEIYGQVVRTGEPVHIEEGSSALGRWWEVRAFRIGAPEERRVAVLFNDVGDRRRAELALREMNETLERRVSMALAERRVLAEIVETTDAQIQVLDVDYRWLAINRACVAEYERLYGKHPRVGESLMDYLAAWPAQRDAARAIWGRALAGEAFTQVGEFGDPAVGARSYEMKFEALRGADGGQIGAFLTGRDVTDRIREQRRLAEAESALRQAQKMDAMGQLTGGVAHDFNNLLTPIVGVLDLLQRRNIGGEREQRLIAGAAQSAERAKTLVQRLLAFARRQPLQPTAVDVGKLARGMASLIASTTGPQIKVVIDAADGLPPAKGDANQIEMALLNLAVNARDAMPQGGTLRISVSAEEAPPYNEQQLRAGRYLRLSVADTGVGMDEATLRRSIEPFFSTKGVGKGTGLGLSMVHGLASQLDGALAIRSKPGLGTNIELWLPESDALPDEPSRAADTAPAEGRGIVLLVDDEELVRLSTADMLADLGYEVVEAETAEAAMELVRGRSRLDLVVTDHLMPGMTGAELARAVQTLRPGVPILLISGYAESEGIAPDLPRLMKPFRKDELVASLATIAAPAH